MVALQAGEALPCGSSDRQTHVVDPAYAADATPPAIHGVTYVVRRVYETTNNCGPGAWIKVTIDAADDAAPPYRLGYSLVLLPGGDPPDGWSQAVFGDVPIVGGSFAYYFNGDDKAFDFQLSVRAVDLNGNESEPEILQIIDDSSQVVDDSAGSCSTRSGGSNSSWALVLGVACFVSQSRRSRARLRQWLKLRSS
jgi:hypothetical protein